MDGRFLKSPLVNHNNNMNTYKVTYEYKGKIGMEISADSEEKAAERAAEQVKAAIKDGLPELKLHAVKIKEVE